MHYLYYCNSAYQLINVLNLHWHRQNANFEQIDNYSADVIVMKAFYGADKMAEIIDNKHVFRKVYILDKSEDNSGAFHALKSISEVVFPGSFIKNKFKIDKSNLSYDVIVTPKFSRIIAAIWQLNKKCTLQLYEDGLASYFYDLDLYVPRSKSYKFFYKKTNHGRDFLDHECLYLLAPDMFIGNSSVKIKKIPEFNESYLQSLKEDFSEYSGYKDEMGKTFLWFSQSMYDDSKILEILKRYKDDVLYCPHPRYPVESDLFQISRKKQIWEIKALSMNEIDNTCLVSINSTALFNPKLLFNEEPYIIFVYKLVKLFYDWSLFEDVIKLFKQKYKDQSKIMIPETISEFEKCLESVKSRIK